MNNYVITIARGFGSGGKQIGLMLSEMLGIPCYESQILALASDYSGINKQMFNKVDEKLRGSMLIKKIVKAKNIDHIIQPTEKSFTSDTNLYNIQAKIIKELANHQSCIIVGKCANNILRDYDNVLSIYVEAERDVCAKNVIDIFGVSREVADTMIYHTDKYRADYYKYYTNGEEWNNPVLYDLTINTGRVDRGQSMKLIVSALKIKFGEDIITKKGTNEDILTPLYK